MRSFTITPLVTTALLVALAGCGTDAPPDGLASVGNSSPTAATEAGAEAASESESAAPAVTDRGDDGAPTTPATKDDDGAAAEKVETTPSTAPEAGTDDRATSTTAQDDAPASSTTAAPGPTTSTSTTSSTTTAPANGPATSSTTTTTATSTTSTSTTTTTTAAAGPNWLGDYQLSDPEFGTSVDVTVSGGDRTITANALPDHETGDFPGNGNPNAISAQSLTYVFPENPTFTGAAVSVRTPGVALNGVRFAPNTAATVTCASGEEYKIEAIQNTYNLGLDVNRAHVQSTGEYHYHGISPLLVGAYESGGDLVLVGFASDGHLIWYSKSGAFTSGWTLRPGPRTGTDCVASIRNADTVVEGTAPDGTYTSDWVFTGGDLDECNGATIDGQYAYVITETFPYVSRCLNGDLTGVTPNVVNRRG